ncbi:hypothetical protein NQ318_019132 [Aromia moschata]|uniref:SLC26A/SulP transporter domain-containing protein n=1 Tax=Aromia moschata TaxID=1265417 RepID=A0AAV8YRA2_9CUCU|nr:hypothetical protein NQ318_019132 [Aromia moschata]
MLTSWLQSCCKLAASFKTDRHRSHTACSKDDMGDKKNRGAHQGTERDLQGEGGGGSHLAYDNPALTVSTTSIDYRHRNSSYMGSNDFIVIDNTKKSTVVEAIKSIVPWAKRKAQSACSKKMMHRRLPFLSWMSGYDSSCAVGDLVAGVTVGLTVIPQALAYANIAGLPTQYGLYSSFLGCIVYIILGSCKDVPVGPSAVSSLMTYQVTSGHGPEYAILLCFLTGLVQILMGLFGLGFLIDFVSGPVSSGFTSAVALIIVTSQVKDVLGIKASGTTFVDTWRSIFSDIHNTRGWDTLLGISCIAVLLILRIVGTFKLGPKGDDDDAKPSRCQNVINKTLWLVGTARNAILVIVCGFIGYSFCSNGPPPFKVIGDVPQGLPSVKPPPFGYEEEVNGTTVTHSFVDMVQKMGSGIIVVPLITLLENIAVCKAFANGKVVDATQEFIAIGACNLANSFVQSFPGTGSLSRSAVNNSSGVRTPLGGLYTGLLSTAGTEYLMLTPDRCLIFPSVDYVRNLVTKHSIRQGIPVVIDCSHIYGADYTAAKVVECLTKDFSARDQPLFLLQPQAVGQLSVRGVVAQDFLVFYNEYEIDNLLRDRSCLKKKTEICVKV